MQEIINFTGNFTTEESIEFFYDMNKDWCCESYFLSTGTSSFNKAHLRKIITLMGTKMKHMAAGTVDFRVSLSSIEIKFRIAFLV